MTIRVTKINPNIGIVVNVEMMPDDFTGDGNVYVASDAANIGDAYNSSTGEFTPSATVSPVPESISDRQFFQQLAIDGQISEAEAIAAVTVGTLPAKLAAIVDALPADQRFAAQMKLQGATVFNRHDDLISSLAVDLSNEQLDDLWRNAALL